MTEEYQDQFEQFKKLKEEVQEKKSEYETGLKILKRNNLSEEEDTSVRKELVSLGNEIDELRVKLDEMILTLKASMKYGA